ncbi:MAG: hypothetical protein KKF44_03170 [Nanoarchaeota archaeon]|nr:hypothetical protein [Nanoarchaeota archaeon]
MNKTKLEMLLRLSDRDDPIAAYHPIIGSASPLERIVDDPESNQRLNQLDRLLFMNYTQERQNIWIIKEYLTHIADISIDELALYTENLISLIELKQESSQRATALEARQIFQNPCSILDGRVVAHTEQRLVYREELLKRDLVEGKEGYRVKLDPKHPRVKLRRRPTDRKIWEADIGNRRLGKRYTLEPRDMTIDFSHVSGYSGYACYLYDHATGIHPKSKNSTYHLRNHDLDIMRYIRQEVKKTGFEERVMDEKGKKYKIYAALFSGPGNHELAEIKELFPDYMPVFIDYNFDQWEKQVAENVKNILKTHEKDVKYGSITGKEADLLSPNPALRRKVIEAAKKADPDRLGNADDSEFHIVWRADQSPFNFGFDKQVQFFKNIHTALNKSDYFDTAHIGVAGTPQLSKKSGLLNMGLSMDTDYSGLENEAYMMYLSSILLGLPLNSARYYADFVLEKKMRTGNENKTPEEKPSQAYESYLFDIGIRAEAGLMLGKNQVDADTQISFVTSRRPDKPTLNRIFDGKYLSRKYQTRIGHIYSPQSIITIGREAEVSRIVCDATSKFGKTQRLTYFNQDGKPKDVNFDLGLLLDNAFEAKPNPDLYKKFRKPAGMRLDYNPL